MSQEKRKWKEVLESKYGVELVCPHLPVKYQSWWWRDLVKVCREGGGEGWFQKEVHWKLGRGDKVRFWEDVLLNQVVFNVIKNPNPLKDDEASALLDAAVLV